MSGAAFRDSTSGYTRWPTRWVLRAYQARDRAFLRRLARRHPGVEIDPAASTNLAVARFALARGARLKIAAGVVSERIPDGVRFHLGEGARLEIGPGTWLRSEVGPVHIAVYAGARMTLGRDGFMNGCLLSAKTEVTIGRNTWIGPGSRVYDADQHDLDADTPERREAVRIGDHVWIASDVTVMKGVEIGNECVVGARSLVLQSLPPNSLALGSPAEPRGRVGDRSTVKP